MSSYNHPFAKSENKPPILPPSNSVNMTDNKQDVCANGVSATKDDDGSNAKDSIFDTKQKQKNPNSNCEKLKQSLLFNALSKDDQNFHWKECQLVLCTLD